MLLLDQTQIVFFMQKGSVFMIFSKKNKVVFIPVSELRPNPMQSRASFDGDSLAALTDSIKQYGILQPLCIAPKGKIPAIVNGQIIPAKNTV